MYQVKTYYLQVCSVTTLGEESHKENKFQIQSTDIKMVHISIWRTTAPLSADGHFMCHKPHLNQIYFCWNLSVANDLSHETGLTSLQTYIQYTQIHLVEFECVLLNFCLGQAEGLIKNSFDSSFHYNVNKL